MYNLAIEVFKLSEVRVPLGTVLTQVGQDLAVMLRSDRICTKSLRTIMIKRRHLSAAFVIAWLATRLPAAIDMPRGSQRIWRHLLYIHGGIYYSTCRRRRYL